MTPKYKRMLAGMVKKETGRSKRKIKGVWSVYIVLCHDGTYYTGTSNNVEARVKKHNAGSGAKYTRTRGPVLLVYQENSMSRSQALVRECAIKALPKSKKKSLALL
jgi:putative endonuclease